MKLKTIPTISAISVYLIFTLLTFENNANSDGFTKLGFPFSFYVYSEGKLTDPTLAYGFGFSVRHFIIDMIILTIFVFLINFVANKWKKQI
ncbi:hypothetical protein [Pedobacter jeongneungensis]|uniref:hypothetical protein n=1 Tax=Pedobacter jeongneungensis TaxID=947309 RepID=UPI00046811EB|nr:hypothetical protein [Pedobacter jeongneungensis]